MKKSTLSFIFISITAAVIFIFFQKKEVQDVAQAVREAKQISLFHYFSGPLSGGLTEIGKK
jgi:hypothetical protein